ncbi:hypothetical protein [Okeania sp. SIO2B3]|uniref:hypothetical protein n=1 Tax=Okeania sp. SIO2B3 TaxID=2607784 RepID=UPI0013C0C575|nr:hypothetical protein [Okeania sp. SIO2B3]NET42716.1 hypothetical protein [Okeania sp. SIO2B3]
MTQSSYFKRFYTDATRFDMTYDFSETVLAREQDAPTAVPGNKNNDNALLLQCTTTNF